MEVVIGKSLISGMFSIVMFDYRRVIPDSIHHPPHEPVFGLAILEMRGLWPPENHEKLARAWPQKRLMG